MMFASADSEHYFHPPLRRTPMSIKHSVMTMASGLCVMLALLLLNGSALAQVTASGALAGTVADKNGAVINGATVTATNKANGQTRTVTTNESGEYKIDL